MMMVMVMVMAVVSLHSTFRQRSLKSKTIVKYNSFWQALKGEFEGRND